MTHSQFEALYAAAIYARQTEGFGEGMAEAASLLRLITGTRMGQEGLAPPGFGEMSERPLAAAYTKAVLVLHPSMSQEARGVLHEFLAELTL